MRTIVVFLLLTGIGSISWLILAKPSKKQEEAKSQAIVVSRYSTAFNASISSLLDDYYQLNELFVKWDSVKVNMQATELQKRVEGLSIAEIEKDTIIYLTAQSFLENAKNDAATMATEKNIQPQREALNSFTDNLYQFLNTVKYDKEKLYLQQCSMAFDETRPALWISQKEEIRNPYMGLYHPKYDKAMLACGEIKKVIDNTNHK